MSNHAFYYKILDSPPDQPLPQTLPSTALDAKDGFIHLSTAKQTPITAKLFFSAYSKLWILKLRTRDIDGEVRFVDGLPLCPHIHDSKHGLGRGNIEAVIDVDKAGYDDWTAVPELLHLED